MNAIASITAKAKILSSNKGHLRLFAALCITWFLCTGFFFWPTYATTDILIGSNSAQIDHFYEDQLSDCGRSATPFSENRDCDQIATEATRQENIKRLLDWLAIILFLPLILPAVIFSCAVIYQWINDGYKKT